MTGQLAQYGIVSPWAHDGAALNVGVEHRLETLDFAPDAAELSGALAGYSGALVAIDARYSVNEGFLELRAPIAQNQPGIYDFTIDSGYRYSNYTTAGATNTYKFEVQYAPLPDVRLRYSYDRVVPRRTSSSSIPHRTTDCRMRWARTLARPLTTERHTPPPA